MVGRPIRQEQRVASSQQLERNRGPWSNSPQGTGILPTIAWKAVDPPTAEPSGETPALANTLVTPEAEDPVRLLSQGNVFYFQLLSLWQFINQKWITEVLTFIEVHYKPSTLCIFSLRPPSRTVSGWHHPHRKPRVTAISGSLDNKPLHLYGRN